MAVEAECRCGRQLRAKDSLAGRKVRCPDCGKPVTFPSLDDDLIDAGQEDWMDDDNPYGRDDEWDEAPRRKTPSRSRGTSRKKKKQGLLSGSDAVKYGIIGGSVLGGIILVVTLVNVLTRGPGDELAANGPPPPVLPDGTPIYPASARPQTVDPAVAAAGTPASGGHDAVASTAPATTAPATTNPATTNPATTDPAAIASAANGADAGTSAAPVANSAPRTDGNLWIVLSNFRSEQAGIGINRTLSVDYRIAGGQPDTAQKYVLFIGQDRGSIVQQYMEVPVTLQPNGSITTTAGLGFASGAGTIKAYMARKEGRQDWKPVSGEIVVGGGATVAQRPPGVIEKAGADAQGKLFALADAKKEPDRFGRPGYSVSFVLQGTPDMAFRYFVILEKNGDSNVKIQTDLGIRLSRIKQGDEETLTISTFGPGGSVSGPFTMYVEKRQGFISREPGKVVSNRIAVQE